MTDGTMRPCESAARRNRDFIGQTKLLPSTIRLVHAYRFPTRERGWRGLPGNVHPAVWRSVAFVYHGFEALSFYGYLSGLFAERRCCTSSAPFGVGVAVVDKEVFSRRTADYQAG